MAPENTYLHIRLLGELEVIKNGKRLALPQSKKTRALLGYFALSTRSHRRERLCSLLWDVADDPRAALRWTLSKLRELVDEPSQRRLIADREHVRLELGTAWVDAFEVKRLLAGEPERASDANLEAARALFRGELLEGLEFPDFPAFDAWCLAERQGFRDLQRRVVTALLDRAAGRPDQALPLARELVQLDPADAAARSKLLELLHGTGQSRAAEAEARASQRLLARSDPPRVAPPVAAEVFARRSVAPDELPFVGRTVECARVTRWLDAAQSGMRVLLVEGEAGIGKSRLLRELAHHAAISGRRVAHAVVPDAGPGWPYAPFRTLLPGLIPDELEPGVRAALAPLLPEGRPPLEGDASTRDAMFRAVQLVFERAAQAEPLVVSFDDAHGLDAASAELLHFLALGARAAPIALVLTARSGELQDSTGLIRTLRALRRQGLLEELALAPLTREEIQTLVAPLVPDADRAALYERCAGNPLYALELAREPAACRDGLPGGVARLVRERLEVLSSEQVELLRWAAVLGSPFSLELLLQLLEVEPEAFVDALERLERYGWLGAPGESGRTGAFSHALVQRALYDQLSEPRRRLMHGRIARALAARSDATERAAEIAHHGVLAGDPAMAARACLSAGRRCLRMFAPADAFALARRGLVYAEQLSDPERTTISIDLLDMSFDARRPSTIDPFKAKLVELSARALDLGEIEHARRGFFLRARLTWERGEVADTRHFSHEVERISRLADARDRVTALADAARCLLAVERDLAQAEAFVLEAEEAVALDPSNRPCVLPLARGLLAIHSGDLEAAYASLEQARLIAVRDGDRVQECLALEYLIDLELLRGRYDTAQPLAVKLLELAERLREGSELPLARSLLALVRYAHGAADAPAELDQALDALRLEDAKQRYSHVLARAAELERARGAWAAAVAHAEEAARVAVRMERHSELAIAQSVLAAAEAASAGHASPARLAALRELLEQPLAADARRSVERELKAGPEPKERRHGTRHRRTTVR